MTNRPPRDDTDRSHRSHESRRSPAARWAIAMAARLVVAVVALAGVGADLAVAAPGAQPPPDDGSHAETVTRDDATLTWSVRPTPTADDPERWNFSYDLEPGARVDDSVRVRNLGAESLSLAVYASDALTTSTGALDLLPAGDEPTEVGRWIVLDATTVDVAPGDHVDIPFTLVVPAGVESGDHTGGIVTSHRTPGSDADGQAVVVDRRLGNRVQVRVGGDLAPAVTVSDVELSYRGTANPVGTGTLQIAYTVTNTGNVRLGAHQTVVIPGRFGFPGREVQLEDMGELLPGSSLTYVAEIPEVWPSVRTTARVELEPVPTRPGDVFAGVSVASDSATIWAVPWTLLAALALALGVPLWSRWNRRRRARQTAQQVQQAIQTAMIVQEAVRAAMDPAADGQRPGEHRLDAHPVDEHRVDDHHVDHQSTATGR